RRRAHFDRPELQGTLGHLEVALGVLVRIQLVDHILRDEVDAAEAGQDVADLGQGHRLERRHGQHDQETGRGDADQPPMSHVALAADHVGLVQPARRAGVHVHLVLERLHDGLLDGLLRQVRAVALAGLGPLETVTVAFATAAAGVLFPAADGDLGRVRGAHGRAISGCRSRGDWNGRYLTVRSSVSMPWMTPLVAGTSGVTTSAPSTLKLPSSSFLTTSSLSSELRTLSFLPRLSMSSL